MHFKNDTVKSDCPVQIFRKMMKYLKITLLVFLEILKKKKKKSSEKKKKKAQKMTSQLVIFRAFLFIFFSSPRP